MATHSDAGSLRGGAERPDAPYALVAGLYVAALLAPTAVGAVSTVVAGGAARYVALLLAATCVTTGAGWYVSRVPGLAVALGRRDATWLLAVVPLPWQVGAFVALAAAGVDVPTAVALLGLFAGAAASLLGVALVAMSRTRHADAVLDGVDDLARWEARWPPRWRRVGKVTAVVGGLAAILGLAARFVLGWEWAGSLYVFLLLSTPFAGMTNARTFRATGAGLAVEQPLQRTLRPWSAFESYTLTDEALVVRTAEPWRPAHRCDRTDVEDVDAVGTALGCHLPRRD
ncbi:hypothetical protein ACFO0N_08780 [Halobium salinum]|uniref:PH domain-containing protein n=1 Tax=Halobium salinum TaxID=1364940 RepID=A0ABD5PC45_9EURY|nr:hypothetical protein [Halobium salinum]